MRCPLKILLIAALPVVVSVMLVAATSTFGQEPAPSHDNPPPHHQPAPQSNAVHRPFAQAGAMFEQMKRAAVEQQERWEPILRALKLAATLLSDNETNLLSGNRPELLSKNKAALLSGNSPTLLSGNSPELLSGNKPKIVSDNETKLFSGNKFSLSILSNLKIEIHIENTGNNNGNHAPPPPHAEPVKPTSVQPVP
jgi:hypothetical protein